MALGDGLAAGCKSKSTLVDPDIYIKANVRSERKV